ncbi:hypothetical protein [Roseomonas sp. USHLN139]|uniref:hypothetical protein n=1 Tax=Roseomonas sp. USHLN139 TaxID=3081298 RepID=UPI003B02956F
MSYRRARKLVEDLNTTFGTFFAATTTGNSKGGRACLAPLGEAVVAGFRALEAAAAKAAALHLAASLARPPRGVERRPKLRSIRTIGALR